MMCKFVIFLTATSLKEFENLQEQTLGELSFLNVINSICCKNLRNAFVASGSRCFLMLSTLRESRLGQVESNGVDECVLSIQYTHSNTGRGERRDYEIALQYGCEWWRLYRDHTSRHQIELMGHRPVIRQH